MTQPPMRPNAKSDDDLAADLIQDMRLSLFEVYRVAIQRTQQHVIKGKTFRNCTLEGPCVMLLVGGKIENCQLGDAGGDARNLTLSPNGEKVIGALIFQDCTFEGCHFFNVGFTGQPDFLNGLIRSAMAPGHFARTTNI